MKLGVLLSLVSALQIAQQSIISELSDFLSETEAAIAGAAFPAGKFISTVLLICYPLKSTTALCIDAWCLIIGSLISLLPDVWFLVFGRFLIGCGAGLGFVCATVMLYERIDYHKRPAHFCILGVSFALGTFIINLLPLIYLQYHLVIFIVSGLTGCCGVIYLLFRPSDEVEALTESPKRFVPTASSFPLIIVISLMILNVSIGVPVFLGFSGKIFESFGAQEDVATLLSIVFPFLQMVVMLFLYFTRLSLNRRVLVLGGYGIAIFLQFLLLITNSYPFLPPNHHTFFMCAIFFILIVVTSIPANTALCLIAEQFSNPSRQIKQISLGRAVMWSIATISTATWMASLHNYGFTVTLLPYFVISVFTLLLVVLIYPKQE